jgi:dimethylglycine dehydrogenase
VTSGGYAHHLGCSMAMGYVPPDSVADGTILAVEINGRACPATVRSAPVYDPAGSRMRS